MGLNDSWLRGQGLADQVFSGYMVDPSTGSANFVPQDTYNTIGNNFSMADTAPAAANTGSGFGMNSGTLGAVSGGLQGLGGLATAYVGYKNLQLSKDQFKFQKGLANRNLANQAKVINNTYNNAGQVAAGMIGGKDASGNYGFTDPAIVGKYAQAAKEKHVDASPIK